MAVVPFGLNAPNVPIIGQPFELVEWWGSFVLRCKCREDAPILVVIGLTPTTCSNCGKSYFLNELSFNRAAGRVTANFGVAIVNAPEGNSNG